MSKQSLTIRKRPPTSLQGILWSKNIKNLDLEKDKIYIIHQVLSYGSLEQIKWLFNIYKRKEIQEVFLKYPKRIYTPASFNFIRRIILNFGNKKLLLENYVKTSF